VATFEFLCPTRSRNLQILEVPSFFFTCAFLAAVLTMVIIRSFFPLMIHRVGLGPLLAKMPGFDNLPVEFAVSKPDSRILFICNGSARYQKGPHFFLDVPLCSARFLFSELVREHSLSQPPVVVFSLCFLYFEFHVAPAFQVVPPSLPTSVVLFLTPFCGPPPLHS